MFVNYTHHINDNDDDNDIYNNIGSGYNNSNKMKYDLTSPII